MIAAIYARKATDQNGVGEEEKSVTRQVEHARAYAARKGWTVAEDCIFVDDGISGADFVKRPGFLRLMHALKPKPPFQVLIMSEESRLGREQIATAYALKTITDAGVRLFFYLTDPHGWCIKCGAAVCRHVIAWAPSRSPVAELEAVVDEREDDR
jgi:site-specific DNA recombinase